LYRFERELFTGRVHVDIVVGADGESDAPKRHGRIGIELRSIFETARGFFVVETVDERKALIEVLLRGFVFGGDGVMVATDRSQ
jgi:hypothetical protein